MVDDLRLSVPWVRRLFSHPAFTGISGSHLNLLRSEVYPLWIAGRKGRLHARRGRHRQCAAGASRPLVQGFGDRLVMTLAHLRLGIPH